MVMCKTDCQCRDSTCQGDLSRRLIRATCQGQVVRARLLTWNPYLDINTPSLETPHRPVPSPNPGLIRHVSGQSRLGKHPGIIHDTP